ncbi:MAG: NUDIX domain-containing protein [Candidatus Asgardarchaeia archaeon]
MTKFQKSVGGIIFSTEGGTIKFLLVKVTSKNRPNHEWWEFPKGVEEKGESELDTLKREIKEETNLDDIRVIKKIGEAKYWFRDYETKEPIKKVVEYYLVEKISGNVKISWEHSDYKWATFEEALALLKFRSHKDLLMKAYREIQKMIREKKEKKYSAVH